MACSAPGPDAPIASSLADYLECHASALGQNGFESAANGFFITAMLTGCLTIYVALIGYRLILGQRYSVREAVLACVRVGLIITFCTRWPSYETVFYRTVIEGPQEIAGQMLQSSGVPVLSRVEIAQRLEQDYDAIQTASVKQRYQPLPVPSGPGVSLPQPANPAPPAVGAPATTEFTVAGLVFLVSTVGSLMAVRLAAALLMAIGPLAILLALFDSLLGLLENWVAALAGTMIASAGVVIVTQLELSFVEARLSQFNANGDPALTDQGLFLTALLFSLCIVGVVVAAGLIGRRLKFSRFLPQGQDHEAQPARSERPFSGSSVGKPSAVLVAPASRAMVVANAVTLEGRRERMRLGAPTSVSSNSGGPQGISRGDLTGGGGGSSSAGLGYSLRRPVSSSRSISYARRGKRQ